MIDCCLHSEIKIGGVWHHYSVSSLQADLDLFGKMGWDGDKDSICTPISIPKGMPEDISLITKIDYDLWKNDAFCQSWLGASEIIQIDSWYDSIKGRSHPSLDKQLGYLFGHSFQSFLAFRSDYPTQIEDIRWIFWFG